MPNYLFCCLNYFSFGHWKIMQWASVSLWHHFRFSCFVFVVFLLLFCLFVCLFLFFFTISLLYVKTDDLGSSCRCSASVLESTISQRSTGSFFQRTVQKNKIWALGVLVATGIALLLGSHSLPSQIFYACILTWVHPSLQIFIYVVTCTCVLNMDSYWYVWL